MAIIQFPGSNTERETTMACERANLSAFDFLWNEDPDKLEKYDGYIIVGGFSYQDRSRAGIIASLDPIIKKIKSQSELNKPVLGICNGAQILVESGIVPGLENYKTSVALTDNKRIKNNRIVGVGYYNAWANLKIDSSKNICAFSQNLNKNDIINIPLAHGEGRFLIPSKLLNEMIKNNQIVFRYCEDSGKIIDEFPINPNGSIYNIAAICNPNGNVMAIMPHPERSKNGDSIFTSMKEYIETPKVLSKTKLKYKTLKNNVKKYVTPKKSNQWIISMIIADNEAITVNNTLNKLGFDVNITRQVHWEINVDNDESVIDKIEKSGELYNSNKEYIKNLDKAAGSFLVRQKDDIEGRSKYESLTKRFQLTKINKIKKGVIWNININSGNLESVLTNILETKILFNPLSHECYRIN